MRGQVYLFATHLKCIFTCSLLHYSALFEKEAHEDLSLIYIFLYLSQGSPLISVDLQCSKEFKI